MKRKLLIVVAAGLSKRLHLGAAYGGFTQSVFPALTCTVQASFRTASPPSAHGVVANGWFFRSLGRPLFWEQSSHLVKGVRIWGEFRRRGKRVAMLFWQQSLGEEVDLVLSPAPIHKHHGGMVESCYCRPAFLYDRLCKRGDAFQAPPQGECKPQTDGFRFALPILQDPFAVRSKTSSISKSPPPSPRR